MKLEKSLYRMLEMYFDILNGLLGVDHECDERMDGRTDGQTEWPLAIVRYNIVRRIYNDQ